MSRVPFILPPGEASRVPAKLVFEGTPPGSATAFELFSALRGEINHFYSKARQAHELGTTDASFMHQTTPSMAIRYSNIGGQETLRVRASVASVQQAAAKAGDNPWQWAVIELHIEGGFTDPVYGADTRAYRRAPAPGEADQVAEGYAYDLGVENSVGVWVYDDGLTPFAISFAPDIPTIETLTEPSTTYISSLLVDFRRFPRVPVTLDIDCRLIATPVDEVVLVGYRYTFGNPFTLPYVRTDSTTGRGGGGHTYPAAFADDNVWRWTSWASVLWFTREVYDPAYAYHYTPAGDLGQYFYDTQPNPLTGVTLTDPADFAYARNVTYHSPSGLIQHAEIVAYRSDNTDPATVNTYDFTIEPIYGTIDTAGAVSRPATVKGFGGWYPALDGVSRHNHGIGAYWEWDSTAKYPARPPLIDLGTVTIDHVLGYADYQRLGTVTIDPVHHALAFKAA